MTEIRRDPCNVASTLPTADPDAAHASGSAHPTAEHVRHEAATIIHTSIEGAELGIGIADSFVAQVDARRMESDPSYRSGVNRAESRIEEVGAEAVRLEARQLQQARGVPVRGSAQCRVQG